MPIDPNISMSYRGIEVPNPLNQLAQVSQIQAAQRQGEVAQMQLEDLKNDRIEMAAFQRDTGLTTPQAIATLMRNPKTRGQAIELQMKYKQQLQADKFLRDRYPGLPSLFGEEGAAAPTAAPMAAPAAAAQIEPTGAQVGGPIAAPNVMAAPLTAPRNAMVTPAAAPAAVPANALAAPPAQGATSPTGRTRQELEYTIELAKMNPYLAGAGEVAKLELAEMMKAPVYHNVPGVGLVDPRTKQVIMPSVESTPTEIKQYELAKQQGFKGTFFDYKRQLAEATRAPVQPVAPTVTQIQDPTNPAQMITVDARRYQGGGVGSPGVIGTTGKMPAIAAAEQKREEGVTQAMDILDTLKTAYDELDRLRAVPSEQRNVLSNAISYVAGTGVGQIGGRVMGTKEQTQRDIISSARNQMLNAIKNATGMSAQQLNSNVEFRSWLESLTDPTRSIEANRDILTNMERFITSKGKYSAKKGEAAAPTPTSAPGTSAPSVSNW